FAIFGDRRQESRSIVKLWKEIQPVVELFRPNARRIRFTIAFSVIRDNHTLRRQETAQTGYCRHTRIDLMYPRWAVHKEKVNSRNTRQDRLVCLLIIPFNLFALDKLFF